MIIGHIVGLTNEYKEQFITDISQFDISIVDLDQITLQIISDKNMVTLYNKLDEINISAKGRFATKAKKEIEMKINEYWKTKIDNHLIKEVNKGKQIICIGLSTYFKNHKIGIKIVTPIKLFIKLNLYENAKKVIKNNLDNNRNEIITGTFDLNYLNLDFLVRKREDLQNTYEKMGYQLKSYNDIYKIVQLGLHNIVPDALYFVDYKNMTKTELAKKKNITGYTAEWLAIISTLKNSISKGFQNKKPYIKEIEANAYEKLKEPVYLYYTTDTASFMPELTNSAQIYKYISTKPIKKYTHVLIKHPMNRLKELGIIIK
jgi:hypothetical protein